MEEVTMMTTMMMDMTGKTKKMIIIIIEEIMFLGLEVIETEIETSEREGGEADQENHQG